MCIVIHSSADDIENVNVVPIPCGAKTNVLSYTCTLSCDL